MIHLLLAVSGWSSQFWLHDLWHPLNGTGYQFWSGLGSDLSEVTLLGLAAVWWRKHNCHVNRCWRLQWHPHPEHGHPVCRKHHPHEVTAAGIT